MENFRLLLATNGFAQNHQSLSYGVWLAETLEVPVVLLGVVEQEALRPHVEALMDEYARIMEHKGIAYQKDYRSGRASLAIAQYAASDHFVTVVGQLGRPFWRRLLQGRSFRRITARLARPLIYVPQSRYPVRKILLNMGGLEYTRDLVDFAIFLAKKVSATINLLHIVEPIHLDYPISHDILNKPGDLLHTHTPQAQELNLALECVRKAGLGAELRLRQGNVIHEILSEIHQGDYDLIGFGSHFSSHSLRHHFLPDVTAEVAETVSLPVLVVPYHGTVMA